MLFNLNTVSMASDLFSKFLRGLPEPSLDFQGKCGYVNIHAIGTDNCTRASSCVCEKAVCPPTSQKKNMKEKLWGSNLNNILDSRAACLLSIVISCYS